jgi:hypothetical protein
MQKIEKGARGRIGRIDETLVLLAVIILMARSSWFRLIMVWDHVLLQ